MSNPYARYQQNSIETATPTRLVVMLYDGAIRFLSQALPVMDGRHYEDQSLLIGKAQAILAHLRATIDFDAGGPAMRHLDAIYITLYDALTDANIHDKPQRVEQVLTALRELREAWVEVDRQCQAQKSSPAALGARRELIAA